ncbi:MAG: Fumarylacetoacetate hydrolase [uncultured Thiotrichaceae bacterium]|uniref:Fumarylacetoacetate hydrolase n=1 Tax=uncultured Thiotrichaceae bacterium TaxID=298394 RepID=A0A6S6UIL2_9GAMM|nr:MAG: Fumarylacetoacetate hydrolase [uncultured Thiotrichaceae bacterium]
MTLEKSDISRIIEMAWEDRTPFEAILLQYSMPEKAVIKLMRRELKPASFKRWRARVTARATKHLHKRSFLVGRAYCPTQYKQR